MKDALQNGMSTAVDPEEIQRRTDDAEDAELQMALALSLKLDEERQQLEEVRPPPLEAHIVRSRDHREDDSR